jgi:hypothetical protein
MTAETEVSVVPLASANVVAFNQILRHPLGTVRAQAAKLSSFSRWIASIGEVASSNGFHISDCG